MKGCNEFDMEERVGDMLKGELMQKRLSKPQLVLMLMSMVSWGLLFEMKAGIGWRLLGRRGHCGRCECECCCV